MIFSLEYKYYKLIFYKFLSFVEYMILFCDFCNSLFYTKHVYKLLVNVINFIIIVSNSNVFIIGKHFIASCTM
jgi:hypothetical protein